MAKRAELSQTAILRVGERDKAPDDARFFSSGAVLLDLVLGGGWARDRVINLVGDRSSGKTLLAIEACANFVRVPGASPADVAYREAEAAFDVEYAQTLGFPAGIEPFRELSTVEQFHDDLLGWTESRPKARPSLYVLDSLDALSDDAEMKREIGDGSYGASKAKKLSEMFRRINAVVSDGHCTLMVISQIREKIGVMFGETKTRSGGKALDFFASQIVWLAETGKLKRTVRGVERVIGVTIEAKTKKNKVGLPFRNTGLQIVFGYGVDDEASMLDWLKKNKVVPESRIKEWNSELDIARTRGTRSAIAQLHADMRECTVNRWFEIEAELEPAIRKYE